MEYNLISNVSFDIPIKNKDIIFYDYIEERFCRYCMKDSTKTTFKSKSHNFPEFLGNKVFFTYTECDSCNSFFNKNYESNLASYFGFVRSALGIPGKNGRPRYEHNSAKLMVKYESEKLVIGIDPESNFVKIDPENQKINLKFPKNPYIPYAVFKSFIKIAFGFMPLEKAIKLKSTQLFLNSRIKENAGSNVNPIVLTYNVINHFNKIFLRVYECNQNSEIINRPKYVAIFGFNEKVYQYIIPNKEFDSTDKDLTMNLIQIFETVYDVKILSLLKKDLERNNEEKFIITYESNDMEKVNTKFYQSLIEKKKTNKKN